jgi:uncharacterized protein (DUF1015 family)
MHKIQEQILITVKPFKALRPRADLYQSIACPPYDVPSFDEAKEAVTKNPLSLLRVIRSEVDFEKKVDPYSDEVYSKAKVNFNHLRAKGYLTQDTSDCYYLYRQKKGAYEQTGFVCGVSVDDYQKGLVKKHENTRTDKENDRVRHIETLDAQTGFVFLMYRSTKELNDILAKIRSGAPQIDYISDDGIGHTLWIINDQKVIAEITDGFKKINNLYIADGHHRAAAASAVAKLRRERDKGQTFPKGTVHEYDYFQAIIYPHDSLNILSYNRAVKDIKKMPAEDFITIVKTDFIVGRVEPNDGPKGYRPDSSKKIGMYFNGQWYLLEAKGHIKQISDPVKALDVSILQEYILSPVLDIRDPKTDERIDFVSGARGTGYLRELVDTGKFKVAFSMYPTTIEQLLAVADSNKLMPPKSTWFDPKPRSGVTIHLMS